MNTAKELKTEIAQAAIDRSLKQITENLPAEIKPIGGLRISGEVREQIRFIIEKIAFQQIYELLILSNIVRGKSKTGDKAPRDTILDRDICTALSVIAQNSSFMQKHGEKYDRYNLLLQAKQFQKK